MVIWAPEGLSPSAPVLLSILPSHRGDTHLARTRNFLQPRPPSLWIRSGNNLEEGLGGTLVLRRKIHFLFLISFPHRNLKDTKCVSGGLVCVSVCMCVYFLLAFVFV